MRKRILIAIGSTLVVMFLILMIASRAILVDSTRILEARYVRRDVQRVQANLNGQATSLGATGTDYATWNEMYDFVQHPTTAFVDSNFTDSVSQNLRVSAVIVLDPLGNPVFLHSTGSDSSNALATGLLHWVDDHPRYVRFSSRADATQGLVSLAQGIMIVACRPIVDEKGLRPVGGTLVLARLLDKPAIQLLSDRLLVSLDLFPASDVPPADARGAALITQNQPIYLDDGAAKIVSAYTLLPDLTGTPAVLLRMDAPSDIRAQGVRSQRYFALSLLLIGVIFSAVVLFVFERTVLSRLLHLGSSVLAIGTGADQSRRVSITGRDQIAYLGAAINGMLDALARSTEQLRASERRNEAFLDAIPDVIFRVTRDGTILDARSSSKIPLMEIANNLVGRDAEQILAFYSFISPEHFDHSLASVETALDSGQPQMLAFHVDTESGRRYYEERFVASGDNEVIVLVREVTSLKLAEEARRKEILLKEIHHRVKNNLQVISSLLALQASATQDPVTRELLGESRNRVRSMGLIHEKLYLSGDERGMSFGAYVQDLAAHLRHSYEGESSSVAVNVEMEEISLNMDLSVPCGLLITELLSNALKYAFPSGRKGTVVVGLKRSGAHQLTLSVSDDGVGFPAEVDIHAPSTLGLRIVNTLTGQLRGTLAIRRTPGTTIEITFPEN